MAKQFSVRAVRCDHRASDEEVYQALARATAPLGRSWEKLEKAGRIALKFNMMHTDVEHFEGRRRELVDDAVARAVLRLLRERTSADLVASDTHGYDAEGKRTDGLNYLELLQEFGVEYDESTLAPFAEYEVPGGGFMFDRYTLSSCWRDADEVVSVAKMKNHGFMGVTLCMKNLFGITPTIPPEGRVRTYFHHAIRLSYVLPDLARITDPALNIVDATTGQWGCEWGGEGRVGNALVAGDQIVATDAVGAHLMGHDPKSDWPTPPFRRDRNHLLVAAQGGFGTVDLDAIDLESEVEAPLNEFDSIEQESPRAYGLGAQQRLRAGPVLPRPHEGDDGPLRRGVHLFAGRRGQVERAGPGPHRQPPQLRRLQARQRPVPQESRSGRARGRAVRGV